MVSNGTYVPLFPKLPALGLEISQVVVSVAKLGKRAVWELVSAFRDKFSGGQRKLGLLVE